VIPDSFIQELLHRTDIVDLIDAYLPLRKAGADYAACCPFHSEKTPSFTVSPSKQFYHCFGCGAHGTAIGFLMEYSGLGFVEAVKELAARAAMRLPEDDAKPHDGPKLHALTEIMACAAKYYYEQLKRSDKAIAYLRQRGVSGEIAQQFGIGYAPDGWQNLASAFADYSMTGLQQAGLVLGGEQGRLHDRFRDRVMFPIKNPKGEIIAFGGRILGEGEPKYLNSPETPLFEKGRELFGLPQARQALREKNTVIVVEGYMDVVALAQHGVGNAVATLGTATTATHAQKLLRQADRVVFCFDGDAAGRKAGWRALENSVDVLSEQKMIAFAFLPEPEDPDSFIRERGKAAFESLIGEAMPLSEFLMKELVARCDMSSAEGRARLVSEAKPLLTRLQTPLLRLQLVKRLAVASGFSQGEVERLCNLKPVAPSAPARAPRLAPSLPRRLLRLLLQKPELARRVPVSALPADSAEARAIARLCSLVSEYGDPLPGYAVLLERLRGSDEEAILSEAAAELIRQPFAETDVDAEFDGALGRLQEGERKRAFARLQEKVAKLGVTGLSGEEKAHYLRVLAP
jgi:DNA primase